MLVLEDKKSNRHSAETSNGPWGTRFSARIAPPRKLYRVSLRTKTRPRVRIQHGPTRDPASRASAHCADSHWTRKYTTHGACGFRVESARRRRHDNRRRRSGGRVQWRRGARTRAVRRTLTRPARCAFRCARPPVARRCRAVWRRRRRRRQWRRWRRGCACASVRCLCRQTERSIR